MKNVGKISIIAGTLAIGIALATTALAQKPSTVPGWGYGDQNHVHTGPPGLSVHP